MKKSLLLLIPSLFLVASCNNNEEEEPIVPMNDPCPEGEHKDDNTDGVCDICGYPVELQHATSCGGDPSAPFYLKLGQKKTINATLSPTPTRDVEKVFTWKNSNDNVVDMKINANKTSEATIEGLKEGKAILTATNNYNDALTRTFTATVIDYDEYNMYLWEYNGERSEFGYVNEEGKKAGNTEGTAKLGNLYWEYTRSKASSLQSSKGALGFGKGKDPETCVKLVNQNTRKVKKIVIETASAYALANITVKVGDQTVINQKTPSASDDAIGSVSSGNLDNLEGNISIQFDTPEYDPVAAEGDYYRSPGAVYLKSIWITFVEEHYDFVTEAQYDLQAKFLAGESDPDFSKLTGTAKPLTIDDEENGFQINFEKIKKPSSSDKLQNWALTNGYVELILKNKNEVIKQLEFDYQNGSNATTFTLYTSVFGGEPYVEDIASSKSGHIAVTVRDPNVNAIRLVPKGNNVGLNFIKVKTVAGEHLEIDHLNFANDDRPDVVNYKVGQEFSPAGLPNIVVTFTNSLVTPKQIPASSIVYYDGPSFDSPADHSSSTTILGEGTTYVVGFLYGHTVIVDDLTVVLVKINFTLVKDINEIDKDGKYLITCPEYSSFVLGSAGTNINKTAGSLKDTDLVFGDTLSILDKYENDYFTITKDDLTSKFVISNFDGSHTFGATKGLSGSVAKSPEYKNFDISINGESGVASITLDADGTTLFLTHSGTLFDVKKSLNGQIKLYKLVVTPQEA